ncbi:FecR domain-containing protein [Devosia salina]|uniref:FecR domain-containing protein n=1 Tax=Devosia salina TaxID=2860336 RepID=A0ABX8WDJ0_9HYPH|nr:FecR domain-containing protein [Devosia salina]QYO76051.1 FecR domain-containing protein [Devosia salina]
MTRIVQVWGTVSVEAEKRNVQHFSVQTPVLAAIVKGTQFTVTYRNGLTQVDVDEGVVEVRDFVTNTTVDVQPGQSAAASQLRPVKVSGDGADDVVYMVDGRAVAASAREMALERQANRELPESARGNGIDNPANVNAAQENRSERSAAGANNRSDAAAAGAGAAASQNSGVDNRQSAGQGGNGHGRP